MSVHNYVTQVFIINWLFYCNIPTYVKYIAITSECRALWGEPEQAIVDVGDDCLRVTNRYSGAGVPA